MFHSYPQALRFLYQLRQFGTKLGLENIRRLDELLGFPSRKTAFIHIAGTNGKGSVAVMLESILRGAGCRTGLFTSPHLAAFSERIQVNRASAAPEQIVSLANTVMEAAQQIEQESAGRFPTFFEFVTAMALEQFAREKVDFVLWETGTGGRLDATNLVTPRVSVITSIGFDHRAWLGDTLEQIAREKGGIIKPGVPCVAGVLPDEASEVVHETCRESGSPLISSAGFSISGYPLGLRGSFQKDNAKIVLAVVDCLRKGGIVLPEESVRAGLESASWPGRMTLVRETPPMIVDGCHNLPAAQALVSALREDYPGVKWAICFGVLKDKEWQSILDILAPVSSRFLLVPVASSRAESVSEIETFLRKKYPALPVEQFASVDEALVKSRDKQTLVCGSLFLAGEVLWKAGVLSQKDELELNEKL